MRISHHFREIVESLRTLLPGEIRDSMPAPELEQPDIVSVFSLATAMCEVYNRQGSPGSALSIAATGYGGLEMMAAALDFAWIVECVACEAIDWSQNGEVWPYYLEDHAEEILALTSEEPDEEFKSRVRQWLGEQELIILREK